MTTTEAGNRWDLSCKTVQYHCINGNIPGVLKIQGKWVIPDDAEKPKKIQKPKPHGEMQRSIDATAKADKSDPVAYVWSKQCRKTIGQLAHELNCESSRVVALFEAGFRRFLQKEG